MVSTRAIRVALLVSLGLCFGGGALKIRRCKCGGNGGCDQMDCKAQNKVKAENYLNNQNSGTHGGLFDDDDDFLGPKKQANSNTKQGGDINNLMVMKQAVQGPLNIMKTPGDNDDNTKNLMMTSMQGNSNTKQGGSTIAAEHVDFDQESVWEYEAEPKTNFHGGRLITVKPVGMQDSVFNYVDNGQDHDDDLFDENALDNGQKD